MMFHVHDRRSYNLEHIAVMVSAFETTYGSLSMETNVNDDDVREMLARIILWHFDLGERDPVRLSFKFNSSAWTFRAKEREDRRRRRGITEPLKDASHSGE